MATTRVYNDYAAFEAREDREENGISRNRLVYRYRGDLAAAIADNDSNEGCWDCTDSRNCTNCTDCRDCEGCWDSTSCRNGRHLHDCTDCHRCGNCEGQEGLRDAEGITDEDDDWGGDDEEAA